LKVGAKCEELCPCGLDSRSLIWMVVSKLPVERLLHSLTHPAEALHLEFHPNVLMDFWTGRGIEP